MKASRLISLLLLVAGWVLAAAAPASAHADIDGTEPTTGQQLRAAPSQVTLTFTGPVTQLGTRVQVIGPRGDGARGRPLVSGSTVRQPLRTGLRDGTYVVNWRAVTSEGHPLGGTFTFGVGTQDPGPADQPSASAGVGVPAPTPVPSTAATRGAAAPSGGDSDGIPVVAYVLGVVALGGILALVVLFERRRGRG